MRHIIGASMAHTSDTYMYVSDVCAILLLLVPEGFRAAARADIGVQVLRLETACAHTRARTTAHCISDIVAHRQHFFAQKSTLVG